MFYNALAAMMAQPARFALLVLDIDRFRAMRGFYGRAGTQTLLQNFAAKLRNAAGPASLVAQLHDNTFGVILPVSSDSDMRVACTELLVALKARFDAGGRPCDLSFCIGSAMLPDAGNTSEAAMCAAYVALEAAKSAGGGTFRVFDPTLARTSRRNRGLTARMPAALDAGEFIPYYQPVIALDTGEICGFEVLARWMHPQLGLLLPSDFIDIAEARNLCGHLSVCLLRHVARDQAAWPQHWRFAFNASPGQLRELIDFVLDPYQPLNRVIAPGRFDLEITESALIGDLDLARDAVETMHANGIRVALDDFGTGYANFLHLREIPFDGLKIDKSFIKDMLTDTRVEACVRAIVTLGASLGMTITAEGVESAEAAARLHAMGCTHAQGYHYARPLPAAGVTRLLQVLAKAA